MTSADSPRDSVQFIEWSPTSCSRALLIANFHGRVTIWTQPSQVSELYPRASQCMCLSCNLEYFTPLKWESLGVSTTDLEWGNFARYFGYNQLWIHFYFLTLPTFSLWRC